jgi:hypothetical protein
MLYIFKQWCYLDTLDDGNVCVMYNEQSRRIVAKIVSVLKDAAELTPYYALCRGAMRFCLRVPVASNGHIFLSSDNGWKDMDHW